MKKLLTSILVLVAFLLAFTTLGLAASDSAAVTVSFEVEAQQSLKITSNNSTLSSSSTSTSVQHVFEIPEPADDDIGGYIQKDDVIELEASSNTERAVQVQAENSIVGSSKGNVSLSVAGLGDFKEVKPSPRTIASGEPGRHEFGVDYRVHYDEDYESGDYEVNLTYTITTP